MDDKVTPNGTKDANLSTEHQREGDARLPSDTLDRGQPTTEGECTQAQVVLSAQQIASNLARACKNAN